MIRELGPLEARLRHECCARVVEAANNAFGPTFTGAILKGSALKGDFYPLFSDIDIHLLVDEEVLSAARVPRPHYALRLQEALAGIDPAAYQANSLQIYCLGNRSPDDDWVRPFPGAYEVISGELPRGFDQVAPADYERKAPIDLGNSLAFLERFPSTVADKPDASLPSMARRMGIELKVMPFLIATVA